MADHANGAYVLVMKYQTYKTREDAEQHKESLIAQLGGNSREQIVVGYATFPELPAANNSV